MLSRPIIRKPMDSVRRYHISSVATIKDSDIMKTFQIRKIREINQLQDNHHSNALAIYPDLKLPVMIKVTELLPCSPCKEFVKSYLAAFQTCKLNKYFAYGILNYQYWCKSKWWCKSKYKANLYIISFKLSIAEPNQAYLKTLLIKALLKVP